LCSQFFHGTVSYMNSALAFFLLASPILLAEPSAAAASAFNSYAEALDHRLARQHESVGGFLAPVLSAPESGVLVVERLTPSAGSEFDGALLHHWRGTAFAPGAKAADFDRLLRDVDAYPRRFSPQVLQATAIHTGKESMQLWMRVRQQHVLTVVMDTTYDLTFGRLDSRHGYSVSRSTRIEEVDSPEQHGFLWRLNTWWSYEEQDAGLYLQIETVSLTRSIPRGLGWAIHPYVESVPRQSLEFTLRAVCNALENRKGQK
jgi:hypothetical protein